MAGFHDRANFIWSVADLLRGDYKAHDYGKVILPLVVLRRLDCALESTKERVLAEASGLTDEVAGVVLPKITGVPFYNTSPLDFKRLLGAPNEIGPNLHSYIRGFSADVLETFEKFKFGDQIDYLDKADLLYLLIQKFAAFDLHPSKVPNTEMGSIFEELIRRFSEQSNETAGEHFTPREVVHLMVDLLLMDDVALLTHGSIIKTLFDPACGTGGMLSVAQERVRDLNSNAQLVVFGQELNDETYAICRSDMMIKGQTAANIKSGNSFTDDGFSGERFDYFLCNPPYGVEWKKVEKTIRGESERLGFDGRFGAGLPRVSDGQFLFLQHMIAKWKTADRGGSRMAIIFNGSPLFTGGPGSGENDIRLWLLANDWLEAVIRLPDQLFYNTGITTFIWILTNRKDPSRKGTVQLIDAAAMFSKMQRSLGQKRNRIHDEALKDIVRIYGDRRETATCKILANDAFKYWEVKVERPLRPRYCATEAGCDRFLASKPVAKLLTGTPPTPERLLRDAFHDAGAKPTETLSTTSRAARESSRNATGSLWISNDR